MTMTALPVHSLPPGAAFTNEPIFRLTVDQYHELIRSGKLTEDDPVELLEGILVFKMPKNTPHSTSTGLVRRETDAILPSGWHCRSQDPITLTDSEPEPDDVIVRGKMEDYAKRHPGPSDIAVVIEVADSSLERDRGMKFRTYARAGLPVYWIVNLIERQVEVYTEPVTPADGDPHYLKKKVYCDGEAISFRVDGKDLSLPVATVLPQL
jgi:Uma2 family endonuclease